MPVVENLCRFRKNSSLTLGNDKLAGTNTIGGSAKPASDKVHPAFII